MSILVYFSSVSGSRELKKQQNEIFQFLDSNKISYRALDITENSAVKDEMRKKVGDPQALPPQIFKGDTYCGNYQQFFEAVEDGNPKSFFKL